MTTLADVWCSRCPEPATHEELVSSDGGKTSRKAAFCDTCAWARRNAPKPRRERTR